MTKRESELKDLVALFNRWDSKCAICSETRGLHRAHIIPRRIFQEAEGVEILANYNGPNVFLLCPNHHKFYDAGQLDKEEATILWGKIESCVEPIMAAALSLQAVNELSLPLPRAHIGWKDINARKVEAINWLRVFGKMLCQS